MERREAIERLQELRGQDLHELAQIHQVTVTRNGRINKGWAGHVCERYLGIPTNSAQSPNFGSWELKSVPLKYNSRKQLVIKETMAVTMIDPVNVSQTEFEGSHLLSKLKKAVIVARIVGSNALDPSYIHSVNEMNLTSELLNAVRDDYDLVRNTLLDDPENGFKSLTGKMGVYIQPRTKGHGHGSISRAFYARKNFLAEFITL